MGTDTTFPVTIFCLAMNFKVIIFVYQITIFSLLIEGSHQQSYEEYYDTYEDSSPTMDECNLKDKMSSTHNKKHITTIENTTDISVCAFHCKVDARCNFWTLHTDNKYCDLFGEEGNLREDENAISGSKDCGEKPNGDLCKVIETFMKDCHNNTDEEHCLALSEHFEENCFTLLCTNNNITTTPATPLPICTSINETYNKECLNVDKDSEHCQDILEFIHHHCDLSPRTEEQEKELTANTLCTRTKITATTQTSTTTQTIQTNPTTPIAPSNPPTPTSTMIDVCIKMEYAVDECEINKTLEGINSEHCKEVKSFYLEYCDDFYYIYHDPDYVPDYLNFPYDPNNPTDDNTCNYNHFGDIKNKPTSICRKTFKAVEHCGFGEDGALEIDIGDREPCQAIWNQFK